jgi:hypothetical protein
LDYHDQTPEPSQQQPGHHDQQQYYNSDTHKYQYKGSQVPQSVTQQHSAATPSNLNNITTLYGQLAPYRINDEDFFDEKGSTLFLVRRLLGAYPHSLTTFAIWAPLFTGKLAFFGKEGRVLY